MTAFQWKHCFPCWPCIDHFSPCFLWVSGHSSVPSLQVEGVLVCLWHQLLTALRWRKGEWKSEEEVKWARNFFSTTQSGKGWNHTTDEKAVSSSGAVDRYYRAGGSMNVIQGAVLTAAEVNLGEIKQCFCVWQKSIVRACHIWCNSNL